MADGLSSQRAGVATKFEADLFRAVMDTSPHAISVHHGDELLYANPAWQAVTDCQKAPENSSEKELVTSSRTLDFQDSALTVTLVHDVTDRKRAERQLIEAQKLESLGRWVGGVVHDFNNLLTAVMLYSDLITNVAEPGSGVTHYNEEIRNVAKRGAGLTGQLLSFLHQRPCEPVVVSVNSLLKGLRGLLERMMGEDAAISFEFASGSCDVRIDPSQLQQIIFNIALNARDAMPSGGALNIRTSESKLDLGRGLENVVRLEIADTGFGMDSETTSHIFEPFFTTKPPGKGTGLGLTIVQKIVNEAGGVVHIESEPGAGTRVIVDLPRTELVPDEDISGSSTKDLPRGHETLLIVEDDLASRSSICALLSHCGYKVLQASNGHEALALAQEFADEIHLLITDIVLPGLSGRDLARRLTALRPETHVLFISGYTIPDTFDAELIFHKPFNSEALAFKVRQALAGVGSGKNDPVGR